MDADAGKTHGYTLLDYALFVAYFPHLIAGPIVRHNDLIPQFRQTRGTKDDLATVIKLFTIVLAKKTLIADNLAPFSTPSPMQLAAAPIWDRPTPGSAPCSLLPDLFRFFRLFRHGAGFLW